MKPSLPILDQLPFDLTVLVFMWKNHKLCFSEIAKLIERIHNLIRKISRAEMEMSVLAIINRVINCIQNNGWHFRHYKINIIADSRSELS